MTDYTISYNQTDTNYSEFGFPYTSTVPGPVIGPFYFPNGYGWNDILWSNQVTAGDTATGTVYTPIGGGGSEDSGFFYVLSGGVAENVDVEATGGLLVQGGAARDTDVHSGGFLSVEGGIASGTDIASGGSMGVFSGAVIGESGDGVAADTTIDGGSLLFAQGGLASGSITFESTGSLLKILQAPIPTAPISGFAAGDMIDLASIRANSYLYDPSTEVLTLYQSGSSAPVASLNIEGDYGANAFALSPDAGGGGTDITVAAGQLFTSGANIVDFNEDDPDGLTAAQQTAIAAGADIYHGLGGNDVVTLPNEANYNENVGGIKTLSWTDTSASTFYTGSQAGDTYTVNGSNGSYFIQEGAGTETVTINGNGSSTITAGSGHDTITITGNGDNIVNGGSGPSSITFTGTGASTINPGTGADTISISGGGSVRVNGDPQGTATIGAESILELSGGDSGSINFAGKLGTLEIDHAGSMPTGVVTGFKSGDIIDLRDVPYDPSFEYTILQTSNNSVQVNNVLYIEAGGKPYYKLQLDSSQNFSGGSFNLSSDGAGGTEIHYNTGVQATNYSTNAITPPGGDPNPYGAVCLIEANLGLGTDIGTGFIIGPDSILTAAHVVAAAKAAGLSAIDVYVGNSSASLDGFHISVPLSDVRLNPNYVPNGSPLAEAASDFAVINVPENLSTFGKFSLTPAYSGGAVNITGYTGGTGEQFSEITKVTAVGPVLVESPQLSQQGQSGGPLWTYNGHSAEAVGLVSLSTGDLQLTSQDIQTIEALEEQDEAEDGYLSGTTVFADANGTGQLAANDASAATDANGNFTLTGGTGPLIAFGGTDISTGLTFKGQLEAPSGSTVIDPLTTLISGLQASAGLTVAAAEQKVLAALGLPSNIDLTTLDPIAGAKSGDAVSAKAFAVGAKVIDTADAIASAFAATGISFLAAFKDAYAGLESDVKTLVAGQSLDLTDQGTITALINAVAKTEGVNASSFVSAVSANIAASNTAIDQKLVHDRAGSNFITDVSSAQAAIQTSTFELSKGVDTINGGSGNHTIIATSNTVTAGDHIDGGTGSSTLALEGPGTFNLTLPTTLANVQTITAEEGQSAYSGGGQTFSAQNQIVVLRAGLDATVNVEADANLNPSNPKAATITIVGAANHDTINLASGNDVVTVGSGETVNMGSGYNTIILNAQTIGAATTGGGTGQNTLDVTGGGTMQMGASITDISKVVLSSASSAYHFTANSISGLTITDNNTTIADALTAGGANQTLTGGGAGKMQFFSAASGHDTFKDAAALFNHDTITGFGDNGDVIDLPDVTLTGLKPLSYVQNTGTSGTLTVSDGAHTAAITLVGVYMTSDFHSGPDGGLGTAITYHPLLV
jgi:hypothetical protein